MDFILGLTTNAEKVFQGVPDDSELSESSGTTGLFFARPAVNATMAVLFSTPPLPTSRNFFKPSPRPCIDRLLLFEWQSLETGMAFPAFSEYQDTFRCQVAANDVRVARFSKVFTTTTR
jgi:hypothetical protein